jgi:hypothetical protein
MRSHGAYRNIQHTTTTITVYPPPSLRAINPPSAPNKTAQARAKPRRLRFPDAPPSTVPAILVLPQFHHPSTTTHPPKTRACAILMPSPSAEIRTYHVHARDHVRDQALNPLAGLPTTTTTPHPAPASKKAPRPSPYPRSTAAAAAIIASTASSPARRRLLHPASP